MTSQPLPCSETWQVPEYDIVLWDEKTQPYCVIIPTINEGGRLHSQLDKMQQLGVHRYADVIIVDGGSTDGSLETAALRDKHVQGLLRKTGAGKLSAQLRCAYAFALQSGYEGIITIDGNDKDDPKAIPLFIDALKAGVDFAQASRFIDGGIAANTPKMRDLAIRLIHAPALSKASGFHWTDTTQGFRGYSRNMLLDEKLAIFRDAFSEYELLAYLSFRAPKLGYRCIEIPTSRIYPKGKVPTKISSFSGNLALLKTLYNACTGAYNP